MPQQLPVVKGYSPKLLRENEELKKALALKLDAMPSGLSAGQSERLERHTRTLSDLLRASKDHLPNGSIQRSIDEALAKLTQQFPMFNPLD